MKDRSRAFAAIIRDEHILMVRLFTNGKDYWTLPGGGVEDGETYEETVIREVQEEVNLRTTIVKHLYTDIYDSGTEKCFLVEQVNQHSTPTLGFDPELPKGKQNLKEVKWQPIKSVVEDLQVAKVIKELGIII